MKIKGFILAIIVLSVALPRFGFAEGFVPSDKRAAVTLIVRDGEGREVSRETGVVVDRAGVLVSTAPLISRWMERVDYVLTAETAMGEVLSIGNVLSVNKRLGLAVISVRGGTLLSATIPGEDRMEYIRGQVSRYRKLREKMALTEKEKEPTPPLKKEESGKAEKDKRPEELKPGKAGDTDLHLLLGQAHHRAKGYSDALEEYRQVLRLRPDNAEALVCMGVLYCEMGMYNEAVEAYMKAIEVRPDAVEVYSKLGTVHVIRGEYNEAIAVFQRALGIDPANSGARYGLGIAYFMAGDNDSALEQYIILNKVDKKRADELFDLVFR